MRSRTTVVVFNAGESFQLNFKAPSEPGDYPFICSFPGHWRMMKGILKVIVNQHTCIII